MPWKDGIPLMRHPIATAVAPRSPVQMSPESTRPYTSRPSFAGPCKLAADVYRAGYTSRPSLQGACKLAAHVYRLGTHGRVPAMVGILMAHVGREFAGSRAFLPHVYRRGVTSAHMRGEFAGRPRTGARRVPRGRPPVLVRLEFRAGVQTRRRCVPAPGTARTREARAYAGPANSARVCTRNPSAVARTRTDLAESCELAADVCRQPAWRQLSTAFLTCPAAQGGRRSRPHATAPPVPVQKDGQEEPLPSPVFSPNRYRPQSRRLPQSQRTLGSTPTSFCARE